MDCNTQKIFQLDYEANGLLKEYLNGKKYLHKENSKADELIDFLEKKSLVFFTEKFIKSTLLPPITKPSLQTVWLELRRNCNLNCIHCYNSSNPCAEENEPLSVEHWEKIISQLKIYQPNTIIMIGGEPLLFKKIIELIIYIKEELNNATLVLYTNLTFLYKDIINIFKTYDIKVVTSIYADNAYIHDTITGHKGSFEKTTRNIKLLRANGIDVRANTVIMKTNQNIVESTVEYIKKITNKTPKIDVIRNTDKRLNSLIPDTSLKKNMIASVQDINKPNEHRIRRSVSGNPCWQGKINIAYDGYISPCIMYTPETINKYNLRVNPLKTIIEEYIIPNFWELSKDKIEVCNICEYRYLCNDCRPLATSLTARVKNCAYDPFSGKWLQDSIIK